MSPIEQFGQTAKARQQAAALAAGKQTLAETEQKVGARVWDTGAIETGAGAYRSMAESVIAGNPDLSDADKAEILAGADAMEAKLKAILGRKPAPVRSGGGGGTIPAAMIPGEAAILRATASLDMENPTNPANKPILDAYNVILDRRREPRAKTVQGMIDAVRPLRRAQEAGIVLAEGRGETEKDKPDLARRKLEEAALREARREQSRAAGNLIRLSGLRRQTEQTKAEYTRNLTRWQEIENQIASAQGDAYRPEGLAATLQSAAAEMMFIPEGNTARVEAVLKKYKVTKDQVFSFMQSPAFTPPEEPAQAESTGKEGEVIDAFLNSDKGKLQWVRRMDLPTLYQTWAGGGLSGGAALVAKNRLVAEGYIDPQTLRPIRKEGGMIQKFGGM